MAEGMSPDQSGHTVYIITNVEVQEAEDYAKEIDKQVSTDVMKVVYAAKDVEYGSNEVSGCTDLMNKATWIVVLFNDKPENALFEYQTISAVSMAIYKRLANIVFVLPPNEPEKYFSVAFPMVKQVREWITVMKSIVSTQPKDLNLKAFQVTAPKEWLFHKFLATGGKHFSSPGRLRSSPGQPSHQSTSNAYERMYMNETFNNTTSLNYQRELPEVRQQDVSSQEEGGHGNSMTPLLLNASTADRNLKCNRLSVTVFLLLLVAVGFYAYTLVYKKTWMNFSTGYILFLNTLLMFIKIGYHCQRSKRLSVYYTVVLITDALLYIIFYVLTLYMKLDIIMCSLILMGLLIILYAIGRVAPLYSCQSED